MKFPPEVVNAAIEAYHETPIFTLGDRLLGDRLSLYDRMERALEAAQKAQEEVKKNDDDN